MRATAKGGVGAILAGACVLLLPAVASAQVTWVGNGGSQYYLTAANWAGGIVPPNTGADSALFTTTGTSDFIYLNTAANLSGVTLQSTSGYTDYFFDTSSGGTLTLGAGGIASTGSGEGNGYFYTPIVLSANQTWGTAGSNFIEAYGFPVSGAASLTTNGYVYLSGANTFTGGVTVASGSLEVDSNTGAGTGAITVNSGAELDGYGSTLANPVTLGANVTLGSYTEYPGMTLTGPITLLSNASTVHIDYDSSVTVSGAVSGPSMTALTVAGGSARLPYDGGSQLVFQGSLNNVTAINVDDVGLILSPSGSIASLASTGLQVTAQGYLGLDSPFTSAGAVSAFLGTYGPTLGPAINGTLGFDTVAGGTANVFSDPINLASFTSNNFTGLGSESAATLSGTITPYNNLYLFGGGGGTLTVTSALTDNGMTMRALTMNGALEPLTLKLQGTATYTGGTLVNTGVLIFDTNVPTTGTLGTNVNGYIGYTELAANIATPQSFVNLFSATGANGVIGFDSDSSRTISANIDLSAFNDESSPFLGTATDVTLSGTITIIPANNEYQFTAVKGGMLTVDTPLTGTAGLTVGLVNPIEANGSTSTVNITPATAGTNTYSGGTTFNSGSLFINISDALGSGPISVPDSAYVYPYPFLASYGGSSVSLPNAISIGSNGGNPGLTVGNGYPVAGDMLVLNGTISNSGVQNGVLGIDGPVTLTGTNIYSGGTQFTGVGGARILVGNASALGTGPISVYGSSILAATGGPVALSNPIQLSDPLVLGQSGNSNLLTLSGVISGYYGLTINGPVDLTGANTFSGSVLIQNANVAIGNPGALGTGQIVLEGANITENYTNPTYLDLSGGSNSINLIPGSTLTLNTDAYAEPASFNGNILGDATDQVVVAGTGAQYLSGTSTYAMGTNVESGRLIAGSNAALGTGPVNVAAGAGLGTDYGVTISNSITLNSGSPGSALGGFGTFSSPGGLTISGGVKVSPGSNGTIASYVGGLSFGTPLTLGSGGVLVFDVQNAGGAAGSGYDTVSVNGALTISATPGSPFTIAVESVTPGGFGTLGPATFNSSLGYTWTLVSATSVPVLNAADFSINLSGFQNPLNGGSFSLGENLNTLTLNFTPVPEPSTWILMAAGLAAVLVRVRRSRRA
jgi:autotransporter-associated beta strand protein